MTTSLERPQRTSGVQQRRREGYRAPALGRVLSVVLGLVALGGVPASIPPGVAGAIGGTGGDALPIRMVDPPAGPETVGALASTAPSTGQPATVEYRRATFTTALPDHRARIAVATALAQIGLPYVWGGNGPAAGHAGFDCSGLTKFSYAAAAVPLPRTAHTQYYAGPHVPPGAALQPGDLVFYGTPAKIHHVGMYVGAGRMVNAPTFGQPVQVAYYRYRGDDYLGATRPAGDPHSLTPGLLPYLPPAPVGPSVPEPDPVFRAPVAPLPAVLPQPGDPQPPEPESAAAAIAESDATAAAPGAAVTTPTGTPGAAVTPPTRAPTTTLPPAPPPTSAPVPGGAPVPAPGNTDPGGATPSAGTSGPGPSAPGTTTRPTDPGAATPPAAGAPGSGSSVSGTTRPGTTPPTADPVVPPAVPVQPAPSAPQPATTPRRPTTSTADQSPPVTSGSSATSPPASAAATTVRPATVALPGGSVPLNPVAGGADGIPAGAGIWRGGGTTVIRLRSAGPLTGSATGTPISIELPSASTRTYSVRSRSEATTAEAVRLIAGAPLTVLAPAGDGVWTVVTAA